MNWQARRVKLAAGDMWEVYREVGDTKVRLALVEDEGVARLYAAAKDMYAELKMAEARMAPLAFTDEGFYTIVLTREQAASFSATIAKAECKT